MAIQAISSNKGNVQSIKEFAADSGKFLATATVIAGFAIAAFFTFGCGWHMLMSGVHFNTFTGMDTINWGKCVLGSAIMGASGGLIISLIPIFAYENKSKDLKHFLLYSIGITIASSVVTALGFIPIGLLRGAMCL